MSDLRLVTTRSAELVQVIRTVSVRGRGIEGDSIREVTQYWAFDGELLAESDPTNPPPEPFENPSASPSTD